MMTARRWLGMMTMAAALAACGEQGGELRDATERRRAQEAGADSLEGDTTASGQPTGRVPAFVLADSAAPGATPAATPGAPVDTVRPATQPAVDPATQQGWSAGVRDQVRTVPRPVTLRDVRVGVNQGFDRVVLEFLGSSVPGYRVEYVDGHVSHCGSGDPVPVAGEARLVITLRGTQAHTDEGQATVRDRERRLQMPVVKEIEFACDYEGVVEIVLGVARPNQYRVTELQNPTRLIIDIQQ
ncbi:MAG TPA: hypothetical protein VFT45_04230 [Longimicrobium sp.]|nr:hypothetical protein [Longimicrobium sp.]